MDNLLKIGISQDTINNMIETSGINNVEELDVNYDNTNKILTALKQLKIRKETIDILLINYIDLFLMNYNKFLLKIRNCDLKELSFDINNDAGVVEEIFLND